MSGKWKPSNALTIGELLVDRGLPDDHIPYVCSGNHDSAYPCMFCDGGLDACDVCGALEGGMPTQCPKRKMTSDEIQAVYVGNIDYRNGQWWLGLTSYYAPRGFEANETLMFE